MKSRGTTLIATLLYLQAIELLGFFTLRKGSHLVQRVNTDLTSTITATSEAAAIVIAIILVFTARSITLRRRNAWIIALILQSLLIVISLLRTIHYILTQQSAIHSNYIIRYFSEFLILGLLIFYRSSFKTIGEEITRKRALLVTLRVFSASLAVGFIAVVLDRHSFVQNPSYWDSLRITVKGFFGISDSYTYFSPRARERVEVLLVVLGLFTLFTAMWELLRPIARKVSLTSENEAGLRSVIDQNPDSDSLSYFAIRDDKSVIWSRNKKAAIPYSVVKGVMVTTGDPIGDRESWPDAMKRFVEESESHAWIPSVYGCSEGAGEIWVRETGFAALEIGDEAVIEVYEFTLEGSAMKNVRQMIARIKRAGISTQTKYVHELSAMERESFARYADEWRRGGDERGFSMALGRFCSDRDPNVVITWSEKEGSLVAFQQFVPWARDGLSLDAMRRAHDAEGGINEELIASTVEWARAHGIKRISLNFATFRSIFERGSKLGAGPVTRANYRILKFLSRFAQMESLYRFNAKFRPVWEPRFVIYPGARNILRVTRAILTVESFWPPVRLRRR